MKRYVQTMVLTALVLLAGLVRFSVAGSQEGDLFGQPDKPSIEGLQMKCNPAKANFVAGEAVNVWCQMTNSTDLVKPIAWHPSGGAHYYLANGESEWIGGVLPLVIPQMPEAFKVRSIGWSPGFLIFLPPHTSIKLLLTYRPEYSEKFKGRVVYRPMAQGSVGFGAEASEKFKQGCLFSNPIEYEVTGSPGTSGSG